MFTNVHKHIGIRKTRNWFRYETFYYPFEFKVFRHKERETQFSRFFDMRRERRNFFLSWLFHLTPTTCGTPPQPTGLALASSENQLASFKPKSQLTVFFKFQNPQPIASRHDVIHVPGPISYLGFLLWHLWLSYPPRSREHLLSMCAPN